MIIAASKAHEPWLAATNLHSPEASGGIHDLQAQAAAAIAFGPFHLLPARRLLLQAGRPVRLGSRALEILMALLERPGELVSKAELMARVWPDTFVEEGNLKVQVAGLRRALGDSGGSNRYLATIPGRGYRFVAPVARTDEPGLSTLRAAAEATPDLPAPMTPMIDRAESVAELVAHLPHQRFITVAGPGGIGKTTVALAVARRLAGFYEHGVRFVDLAPLLDPGLVPGALAAGLGLETRSDDPTEDAIAALRGKRVLLVLDNCEHVIEAAAAVAVEVLHHAPGVQILATSREPLRVEGEHVHRLPLLACPPASARLTAAQALGFPAVQLFVERAEASSGAFRFGDEEALLVADICRRLDGLPLAIELAAARIDAFGVRGLAVRLRDPLQLLTGGRRPALPRHQTLRATFDWGHELLSEPERTVLRRLAIFPAGFTLEAASAMAACAEIAPGEVVEHVANLVTKSMIAADVGGATPCYRLLGTTRAYALEKLFDSGDLDQVKRRHAAYLRHLGAAPLAAERLAACGRLVEDVGVAQDWTGAPTGLRHAALAASPVPG
jgi:predicted ATPase